MESIIRNVLVRNLLERLEADASSEAPKLLGVVTKDERTALRSLFAELAESTPTSEPLAPDVYETNKQAKTDAPICAAPPAQTGVTLNLSSLAPIVDNQTVVCFDFGTAKSKAFAGAADDEDNPDPPMYELGLGQADKDSNDAVYNVHSSIWISDAGLLFAGSAAIRHSQSALNSDPPRKRLDSIKQELNLSNAANDLRSRLLDKAINPTSVPLTYEDALCFYLAFLTDLTGHELERRHGLSRYIRRRFTLPAWQLTQRVWAGRTLHLCLKRAQLLADTFSGRWANGVPVAEFKQAADQARNHVEQLDHLMHGAMAAHGVLEPLAAGSGRVWADKNARSLMLVLDVGAGTTDFSLFWIVQNPSTGLRRAFPVYPSNDAFRMAGDFIDDILVKYILEQAHGQPDDNTRRRIEAALRITGVRFTKEQLFNRGSVDVQLVTDQLVTVTRDAFEAYPQLRSLAEQFRSRIQGFLSKVDPSWEKASDSPMMVLTGGSASVPFVQQLAGVSWNLGSKSVVFSKAKALPELIANTFDSDFQREYPQLAVAIGGVLPLIDEKEEYKVWLGGALPPGGLQKYAVTGV